VVVVGVVEMVVEVVELVEVVVVVVGSQEERYCGISALS